MKSNIYHLSAALFTLIGSVALADPGDDRALKIIPGISIRIVVEKIALAEMKEVAGVYPVQSTGIINLPFIGAFKVEGLTRDEAEAAIENTYKDKKIYKNPQIEIE